MQFDAAGYRYHVPEAIFCANLDNPLSLQLRIRQKLVDGVTSRNLSAGWSQSVISYRQSAHRAWRTTHPHTPGATDSGVLSTALVRRAPQMNNLVSFHN